MGATRMIPAEKLLDVWRQWAEVGTEIITLRQDRRGDWAPVHRMITVADDVLLLEGENLRRLLKKSRRYLNPLGDPLLVDFGVHRWLSKEPEPAYSDWLQWVVKQLPTPELVFRLFRIDDPEGARSCEGVPPWIGREDRASEGHEGRTGRLDLAIRYPGRALIVVEVKKTSADEADTVKQRGYRKWLESQAEPKPHKHTILLARGGEGEQYEGFRLLTWARLCIGLRRMIPELLGSSETGEAMVAAAMILAFVGAVEQNLCGLSASIAKHADAGKPVKVGSALTGHIEESLCMEKHHGNV